MNMAENRKGKILGFRFLDILEGYPDISAGNIFSERFSSKLSRNLYYANQSIWSSVD